MRNKPSPPLFDIADLEVELRTCLKGRMRQRDQRRIIITAHPESPRITAQVYQPGDRTLEHTVNIFPDDRSARFILVHSFHGYCERYVEYADRAAIEQIAEFVARLRGVRLQ